MLASYLEKINDHTGFYNIINDHGGKLLYEINLVEIINQRAPATKKGTSNFKIADNFFNTEELYQST